MPERLWSSPTKPLVPRFRGKGPCTIHCRGFGVGYWLNVTEANPPQTVKAGHKSPKGNTRKGAFIREVVAIHSLQLQHTILESLTGTVQVQNIT